MATGAPILLRRRNFQWYWNSAPDPWSVREEQWQKYTDIENEIIEDGHNQKRKEVEIDGNYVIDLKHQVQYKKGDSHKQRSIKRVQLDRDRSSLHLREERFSLPVPLATSTQAIDDNRDVEMEILHVRIGRLGHFAAVYAEDHINNQGKSLADVVQEAANGIIKEGSALNKEKEARWLAAQLLAVKHFGLNIATDHMFRIPAEIGDTVVHMYTLETFLYKLVNSHGRHQFSVTNETVKTLGPFYLILQRYLFQIETKNFFTVYRGLSLTDEQRQLFMTKRLEFTAFTSTSKNRVKAEQFGDTLLVIDLEPELSDGDTAEYCGSDIAHLSDFLNEEEFLIRTGTFFKFIKHEYNSKMKKHLIYLKSINGSNFLAADFMSRMS
ncbi:unnamed protein product [Rotaria sp. Silwood2]|nr:unnamed protein product [Rotaria sp. Silwood2]